MCVIEALLTVIEAVEQFEFFKELEAGARDGDFFQ